MAALDVAPSRSQVPYACLWAEGQPDAYRQALDADLDVDVCIVGGGFTGLWTAWHLKQLEPTLRIAVVEASHIGFGASGRNGGWVQTALPTTIAELAEAHGSPVAMSVHRAMVDAVSSIGAFARVHAPEAHFAHAGQLQVARTAAQAERLQRYVREHHNVGLTDDDLRWLSASELRPLIDVSSARGAYFTPHCAAVNPRPLVDALANDCENRGVRVFENTRALTILPRRVSTAGGTIRCAFVVRATEGYTVDLPGLRRAMLPVFSLMIATEPLSASIWNEIGWADRFTFADGRHLVIYAQRTADNRIAFGGRGAPYRFGSKTDDVFADNLRVHTMLRESLVELFPILSTVAITHRWGGALGVPRDWTASVGLDRSSGMAWGGGYVGDGVGATHLAGQTLADLIVGLSTDRTRLPWVDHRSRSWEPEPLRSVGVRAAAALTGSLDRAEAAERNPAVRSWLRDRLM